LFAKSRLSYLLFSPLRFQYAYLSVFLSKHSEFINSFINFFLLETIADDKKSGDKSIITVISIDKNYLKTISTVGCKSH